jgi:hypothetical protein
LPCGWLHCGGFRCGVILRGPAVPALCLRRGALGRRLPCFYWCLWRCSRRRRYRRALLYGRIAPAPAITGIDYACVRLCE